MSKQSTFVKDIGKVMRKANHNVTFASRRLLPPLDLREEGNIRENAFNDILCELWGRNEKIEEVWVTKGQLADIMRDWHFPRMPDSMQEFTYHSDFGDVRIKIEPMPKFSDI